MIGGRPSALRPRKYWLRCTPRITSTVSMPPSAAPEIGQLVRERDQRRQQRVADAYLIISAVRVLVRRRGTSSNGSYRRAERVDAPLVDPAEDDAIGEQEIVHRFAFGQELRVHATPKSTPAFFPDASSSAGSTCPSVVPGTTVLLTTTT